MAVKAVQKNTVTDKSLIPFDASTATTLPTGGKKGQGYNVTNEGTVLGTFFLKNDIFFALKDNPTAINDFGDIQPLNENITDTDYELLFLTTLL